MRVAPLTTWLFVSTNPSGVTTKPEPLPVGMIGAIGTARPRRERGPRAGRGAGTSTSMRTTEGLTSAATAVMVRE